MHAAHPYIPKDWARDEAKVNHGEELICSDRPFDLALTQASAVAKFFSALETNLGNGSNTVQNDFPASSEVESQFQRQGTLPRSHWAGNSYDHNEQTGQILKQKLIT